MKLFKRIKAEGYVEPKDTLTAGKIDFGPPPEPPVHWPKPEMTQSSVPYAELISSFPLHENTMLKAISSKASEALKKKTDEMMLSHLDKKALLSKPSAVSSVLGFEEPAKDGKLYGVWSAVLKEIEWDIYHQKAKLALLVTRGPDKGKVLVLQEGDELTVNYAVTM